MDSIVDQAMENIGRLFDVGHTMVRIYIDARRVGTQELIDKHIIDIDKTCNQVTVWQIAKQPVVPDNVGDMTSVTTPIMMPMVQRLIRTYAVHEMDTENIRVNVRLEDGKLSLPESEIKNIK